MKKITCELCGSTEFVKDDEFFVCQGCGTKYTLEQAKKMMKDEEEEISTVKVDTTDKINNLYELARRSKKEENDANAAKYYQMILIEDPNSWEANFYTVFFQERQCKIAEIEKAAMNIRNCLDEVVRMIHDYEEPARQKDALMEVGERCEEITDTLVTASINFYNDIDSIIKGKHLEECRNRIVISYRICLEYGNAVEKQYSNDLKMMKCANLIWNYTIVNIKSRKKSFYKMPDIDLNVYHEKIKKYDPEYVEDLRRAEWLEKKLTEEIDELEGKTDTIKSIFVFEAFLVALAILFAIITFPNSPVVGIILIVVGLALYGYAVYSYLKKKKQSIEWDKELIKKKKELEELKKQNH